MQNARQEQQMSRRTVMLLVIAIASISCAALFFRKAQATHPLLTAGFRLSIAALCLWPFVLKRALSLPGKFWRAGLLAGLCYAVHFGAWVWSLNLTTVAASVTLVTATPLFLGLLRLWLALALAVLGVTVIGANDMGADGGQLIGNALALLGAVGMAGYLLVGRSCAPEQALPLITVAATIGALLLLGVAVAIGLPLEPASSESLFWIAMAALIPQLIGHTSLTLALRDATPTSVAMSTVGEPVGAALLAFIFLGESVSLMVAVGCAFTLLAVGVSLSSSASD
jgi:drug/metabolite transporter (DMT)-like permease